MTTYEFTQFILNATTALNSGVAAQNVARLLGHKDGATTLKYCRSLFPR